MSCGQYSIESQLEDLERRFKVRNRWLLTDDDYCKAKKEYLTKNQLQLRSCLRAAVVKHHYLLQAKAKYAGK